MAAVISKLQSKLEQAEGNGAAGLLEKEIIIGKGFCRHAGNRVARRLKGLRRNHDRYRLKVADVVLGSSEPVVLASE